MAELVCPQCSLPALVATQRFCEGCGQPYDSISDEDRAVNDELETDPTLVELRDQLAEAEREVEARARSRARTTAENQAKIDRAEQARANLSKERHRLVELDEQRTIQKALVDELKLESIEADAALELIDYEGNLDQQLLPSWAVGWPWPTYADFKSDSLAMDFSIADVARDFSLADDTAQETIGHLKSFAGRYKHTIINGGTFVGSASDVAAWRKASDPQNSSTLSDDLVKALEEIPYWVESDSDVEFQSFLVALEDHPLVLPFVTLGADRSRRLKIRGGSVVSIDVIARRYRKRVARGTFPMSYETALSEFNSTFDFLVRPN